MGLSTLSQPGQTVLFVLFFSELCYCASQSAALRPLHSLQPSTTFYSRSASAITRTHLVIMVVPSQHSLSAPLWSSIPAGPSLSAQRCFRQRLTLWLLAIELVDLARYFCQRISSILKAKLFSFLPSYSISAHKLFTRADQSSILSLDWFHSCHLLLCFGEIKYCLQKSWVLSVNPHFFNSTNINTDKDQIYQIRSLFLNHFRLKITSK